MRLTTLPGEMHGLGVLMAEAMFALAGCPCISLGTQTPPQEIVDAVMAHRVEIVALSFAASMPIHSVITELADLRRALTSSVAIWAGGASPALRRKLPAGVKYVEGLESVEEAVAVWLRDAML